MQNGDAGPKWSGLSEGLCLVPERLELTAALDKSGSVVLINQKGDIVFYAADGKMMVQRLGHECDACIAANLALAEAVAGAWNVELKCSANPTNNRPRCGLGA